jgi:hypothetical protein
MCFVVPDCLDLSPRRNSDAVAQPGAAGDDRLCDASGELSEGGVASLLAASAHIARGSDDHFDADV